MRAPLSFDLARAHYGAATASIRRILTEWASVDWFAPPEAGGAARGRSWFEEHNFVGRLRRPDLFPARLDLRIETGSWADFDALCQRVRQPPDGWDWKYSALKPLSHAHSEEHGWTVEDEAKRMENTPGDLFVRIGGHTFWGQTIGPRLDVGTMLQPVAAAAAGFYLGYARVDALDALEWQLAERSDDVSGNPFFPLVRCYAAGVYPFSLGPDEVVLFAFRA